MAQRYAADQLVAFSSRPFARAGLDPDKAATTAALLVEADLMGHSTHGLQLAGAYLGEIEAGRMARTGAPEVVADRGPTLTWDGCRLPGVWLTERALARERAALADGLELYPGIIDQLSGWAHKLGVPLPQPL